MKQIQKEVKSYKTMYVANDGTEFSSEEECRKYDASAKGVIFARYNKLVVGRADEWSIFNVGSDDSRVDIVKPTCDRDKDTIMQLYFHITQQGEDKATKIDTDTERAIKEDDVLLIGWNYDQDWCWSIGTANGIKERIDNSVQDFTKDDTEQK